nr:thioredoxin family protein [Candidatus Poseidoniaceae archaeon]
MSLSTSDIAPDFNLKNANGNWYGDTVSLEKAKRPNGIVVAFECNHCPYVVAMISRMNAMAEYCENLGIGYVGINSNDENNYPEDSYENMVKRADNGNGMPYSYLHDATQQVAQHYGAKRTPEFFLFNSQLELVYQGRMDDSPRNPAEVTTSELTD